MPWIEAVDELKTLSDAAKSETALSVAGRRYIASGGSERFISAIGEWFNTNIAEYCEGYAESLGRRLLWVFPNQMALVIGADIGVTLTHLTEEITDETPLPETCDENNWSFVKYANGWMSNKVYEDDLFLEMLTAFEAEFGTAELVLPWERRLEQAADEDKSDFIWVEEGDEAYAEYNAFYDLLTLINDGKLQHFSKWHIIKSYEDEYMSEFSDYGRFESFTGELSDSKLVILNLEEHCAACSSGTYKDAVASDPEMEGKFVFLTWSQHSQGYVNPAGAINIDSYIDDEDVAAQVEAVALKHGVPVSLFGGDLNFSSPDW
jgi:hypothetical protein